MKFKSGIYCSQSAELLHVLQKAEVAEQDGKVHVDNFVFAKLDDHQTVLKGT